MTNDRYRLIQDGQPVAWTEGSSAFAEISHYAAVYSQDGPVTIERRINGRWRPLAPVSEGVTWTDAGKAAVRALLTNGDEKNGPRI